MRVFMSRHGESTNNVINIIGGDCHITKRGQLYSNYLAKYFENDSLIIWTSKLKRTIETTSKLNGIKIQWSELNEIYSGDYEEMVIDDIKTLHPIVYQYRNSDKLNNKYPNGESYIDLQVRVNKVLDTINMDIDSTLLIVAHQAVCRVIYSYFTKIPISDCINTKIDLHTLYKLESQNFFPIQSFI